MEKLPQNQTDIPVAEAKAEGQKLEWGTDLGRMSLSMARDEIYEINMGLKSGEKKWRLPTKDELVTEFNKIRSTPPGFQSGYYWSSTTDPNDPGYKYYDVDMGDGFGEGSNYESIEANRVRLVRDVA